MMDTLVQDAAATLATMLSGGAGKALAGAVEESGADLYRSIVERLQRFCGLDVRAVGEAELTTMLEAAVRARHIETSELARLVQTVGATDAVRNGPITVHAKHAITGSDIRADSIYFS